MEVAARIWCDPDYSHVAMNPEVADKIAQILMAEERRQSAQQHMHPTGATVMRQLETHPIPAPAGDAHISLLVTKEVLCFHKQM